MKQYHTNIESNNVYPFRMGDFFVHQPEALTSSQIKQLPRQRQRLIKLMQEAAQGTARKVLPRDEVQKNVTTP